MSQESDGISKVVFGEVPLGVSSYVCSFFPIPNSWGDAGGPDNQTQKRRRFICVKGKSTTKYYHINTFSKECFSLLHILKSHLMRGLVK